MPDHGFDLLGVGLERGQQQIAPFEPPFHLRLQFPALALRVVIEQQRVGLIDGLFDRTRQLQIGQDVIGMGQLVTEDLRVTLLPGQSFQRNMAVRPHGIGPDVGPIDGLQVEPDDRRVPLPLQVAPFEIEPSGRRTVPAVRVRKFEIDGMAALFGPFPQPVERGMQRPIVVAQGQGQSFNSFPMFELPGRHPVRNQTGPHGKARAAGLCGGVGRDQGGETQRR